MSPRFVLGRENVPCVAEVVNRSLKADCTDFTVETGGQTENAIKHGINAGDKANVVNDKIVASAYNKFCIPHTHCPIRL